MHTVEHKDAIETYACCVHLAAGNQQEKSEQVYLKARSLLNAQVQRAYSAILTERGVECDVCSIAEVLRAGSQIEK